MRGSGFTALRSVFMAAMRWGQERSGALADGSLAQIVAKPLSAQRGEAANGHANCDELATEPRAFTLASCCTCAPAMLAKRRF